MPEPYVIRRIWRIQVRKAVTPLLPGHENLLGQGQISVGHAAGYSLAHVGRVGLGRTTLLVGFTRFLRALGSLRRLWGAVRARAAKQLCEKPWLFGVDVGGARAIAASSAR